MKLLLDQNLSYRLIQSLQSEYPGSEHVHMLGMGDVPDKDIWNYARANDYAVVTLDADFHEYSILWEGPPLIIWLKCGNQPKGVIREKLLTQKGEIERAFKDPRTWCIEVY